MSAGRSPPCGRAGLLVTEDDPAPPPHLGFLVAGGPPEGAAHPRQGRWSQRGRTCSFIAKKKAPRERGAFLNLQIWPQRCHLTPKERLLLVLPIPVSPPALTLWAF